MDSNHDDCKSLKDRASLVIFMAEVNPTNEPRILSGGPSSKSTLLGLIWPRYFRGWRPNRHPSL